MLVEINLLPKKEQKNYTVIVILLAVLLLTLVAGFFLFWQGRSYEQQISTLDNQITTTQKLAQIEQESLVGGQVTNSVAMLESAVNWATDSTVKTVPIFEHVTGLLPKRGFIQTITYSESGNVSMTVQFDTSRDSAYYLKTLLDSEWFLDVKLTSLSTNQTDSSEAAPIASNTEEHEELSGEQTVETPQEATSDVTNETSESYVPRYIGQYEITLDQNYLKELNANQSNLAKNKGGEEE